MPRAGSDVDEPGDRGVDAGGEGGERLVVRLVVLARRPAPRRLLEPALEGRLLRLALRAPSAESWTPSTWRWSNSFQPASTATSADQPAPSSDAGRGLRVPAHLAGHDDVGRDAAGGEGRTEHARLLVAGGGEDVVVGGAERRLAVPHQQDAAHARDQPVEPPADDLHGRAEEGVHLVGRLAVEVAVVDLLRDHGHPEQPEHLVEPPLLGRHGAAGALGVRRHELVAGQHPRQVRRHPPHHLELLGVVGLHPVGHRAGEVHQRVAEGRHLPVEHADDAGHVVGGEHEVVELEVVVDHAGRDVVGLVRVEPRHHRLEVGHVLGAGVAVARRPALDLAADVARALAEVGEAGGLRVDAVQLGEHVDGVEAQGARLLGRERHVGRPLAARDHAGDPVHRVEVAADHVGVVAEGDHRGDVVEDRRERRLDDVLPVHVVRAPGLGALRGAPHDEVAARRVAQQVGQVGGAAGELPHLGLAVEALGRRGVRRGATRPPAPRRRRPPRAPRGRPARPSRRPAACSFAAWSRITAS